MRPLTRSRDDKWIAGVCGGVADHTGIDATIIRLVLVVCTLLGAGSLIVGYVIAWILMPMRDRYDTRSTPVATDAPTTPYEPAPPSR